MPSFAGSPPGGTEKSQQKLSTGFRTFRRRYMSTHASRAALYRAYSTGAPGVWPGEIDLANRDAPDQDPESRQTLPTAPPAAGRGPRNGRNRRIYP